jgi:hypothetical protein
METFVTSFTMNLLIVRICTKQQLISRTPQPTRTKSSTKEYGKGYKQMVVLLVEECRNEQNINKKLNHLSNKFSRWGDTDSKKVCQISELNRSPLGFLISSLSLYPCGWWLKQYTNDLRTEADPNKMMYRHSRGVETIPLTISLSWIQLWITRRQTT